jgi:allophanate hydrolase
VAERYVAIRDFIEKRPGALHPVTREITLGGAKPSAADAFSAYYKLKGMRRITAAAWEKMDAMMLPTAPRSYTIAEMKADPIKLNSNLGIYTNFVNLLDLSAVAVPAGMQTDGRPFGITLLAPAWSDNALLSLGDALHRTQKGAKMGALNLALPASRGPAAHGSDGMIQVAVCGAHMQDLPLNPQLTQRGARLVQKTKTAPRYRFYALPGGPPFRPGLVRTDRGKAIEVEVWEMSEHAFGSFMNLIPSPLTIGTIELADGGKVKGFLCEGAGIKGAKDITKLGGWRKFLATQAGGKK